MRLAPLVMAGVAGGAAVGAVALLAPRHRPGSAAAIQARRIAGVMLAALALILSVFAVTLDSIG